MFELLTARNCSTQPVWDCGGLNHLLSDQARPIKFLVAQIRRSYFWVIRKNFNFGVKCHNYASSIMCTLKMAASGCSSSGPGIHLSVRVQSGPHCLLTKSLLTPLDITFGDLFLCVSQDHRVGELQQSPPLTKLSCLYAWSAVKWRCGSGARGHCGALCRVFFQVRDLWICKSFMQECMFFEVGSFVFSSSFHIKDFIWPVPLRLFFSFLKFFFRRSLYSQATKWCGFLFH